MAVCSQLTEKTKLMTRVYLNFTFFPTMPYIRDMYLAGSIMYCDVLSASGLHCRIKELIFHSVLHRAPICPFASSTQMFRKQQYWVVM